MPQVAKGNVFMQRLKDEGFLHFDEATGGIGLLVKQPKGKAQFFPASEFVNVTDAGLVPIVRGMNPGEEARAALREIMKGAGDNVDLLAELTKVLAEKQQPLPGTEDGSGDGGQS